MVQIHFRTRTSVTMEKVLPSLLYILLFILSITAISSSSSIDASLPIEGLIWNGSDVSQDYLPRYMASLRSRTNVHFCGGTIISTRHILTAAQCVLGRAVNSVDIVVGTVLRNAAGVTYTSNNLFIHPRFDRMTLANDIALVHTSTVIVMNENVQRASIYPSLTISAMSVKISGWGRITESIFEPDRLHTMNATTIANSVCMNEQKPENAWRITDGKICTDNHSNHNGICYGDEGGGLISGDEIIGVASFHSHCDVDVPNVYERVATHRIWISTFI